MKDQSKTKQALIQELASLRQRIAELERSESERKQAEEALKEVLREDESLLHSLLDYMHDAMIILDWDGSILFANRAAAKIIEYERPEEFLGHNMIEYLHPDSFQKATEDLEAVKADKMGFLAEYQLYSVTGRHIWVESIGGKILFRNASANLVCIRDITERKRAQEALKESEERYRTLVENASEGIYVAQDGMLKFINRAGVEIAGYSEQEIISKPFIELIHPDDRAMVGERYLKRLKGEGFEFRYPFRVIAKNGDIKWLELGAALIDFEGRPATLNLVTDITKRKQMEDALHRSEENFRHSFDDSPMGVRIVTIEGETIYANRAILDIHGYDSIEELKTTPVERRYTREGFAEHQIRREKRKRGDDVPPEYEISIVKKDSEVRHLLVLRREILWDGERQFQVIYQDITNRKQAEEALKISEEKYRDIFENIVEGIYRTTPEGRFIIINQAFAAICGYASPEEMMEKVTDIPKQLYANPEDRLRFQKKIAAEGFIKGFEVQFKHPIKKLVWVSIHSKVISDEQGNVRYYDGTIEDITNRKQAEEALRESETKLQAIFNTVGTGIIIIDKDTQIIIEANQTAAEMTGFPKERIIGQICHSLVCPAQAGKCPVKDLGQSVDHSERKLLHADGHQKDILKTVYPITIEGRDCYLESFIDITDRKRMEEELHVALGKYMVLFDAFPLGISITDAVGHIIETNRESERLLKISREEQISRNYVGPEWQIICPDGTPMPVHEYASVRAMKENCLVENVEMGIVKGDQEITWINVTAAPIPLKNYGVAIAYGDITNRKRAEEALRESEIRYRELFENMESGVSVYETRNNGEDFIFKEYNAAAEMLDKIPRGQVIGRSVVDVFPRVKDFGLFDVFQRVYRTGKPERHPVTLYKDERISGWRENYVYKLPNGEIVAVFEDITKLKQVERSLQESEEKYRTIIENMEDGYHEVDIKGNFTFFNESMRKIMGYEREELLGMNNRQYADEENTRKVYQTYNRVYRTGEPVKNFEWQIIRKDGDRRDLEVSISLIRDGEAHPTGFRGIVRDTTERKQAEEELRTSRSQLRALATRLQQIREEERIMIAREIHDEMGGGLTGLKMDLSWLLRKMGDADPCEERVALMDKIHTSNALIDQMIKVVRRISADLRPSVLDDLGLIAALELAVAGIYKPYRDTM